jgi:hypothetical protein
MGSKTQTNGTAVTSYYAALAAAGPLDALTLAAAGRNIHDGRASDVFNLRTPEHIILAGKLGFGKFDQEEILHRVVRV